MVDSMSLNENVPDSFNIVQVNCVFKMHDYNHCEKIWMHINILLTGVGCIFQTFFKNVKL